MKTKRFQNCLNWRLMPLSLALILVTLVSLVCIPTIYAARFQDDNECENIAGMWDATESVTVTCRVGNDTETETAEGSGRVSIQQTGCNISYTISQTDIVRTGTITDKNIELTGKFVLNIPTGATVTENKVTIVGSVENAEVDRKISLTGTGFASGLYQGISVSCSGTSTATLTNLDSEFPIKSPTKAMPWIPLLLHND